MEKKRPDIYYIPQNYNDGYKIRDIPYRNIAETVVAVFLLFKFIKWTPFVWTVQIIAGIPLGIGVVLLFLHGIKDESITQFLWSYIVFMKNKRKLALRKVGENDKEQEDKEDRRKTENKGKGESVAEVADRKGSKTRKHKKNSIKQKK